MIARYRSKSGFALIAVMGVIVLMLVYLIAVQGTIQQTRLDGRRVMDRQVHALGEASALAMVQADPAVTTLARQAPIALNDDVAGTVTWRLLGSADPLWASLAVEPVDGDCLVEIQWPSSEDVRRYIVNAGPARDGAIRLK